MKKKWILSAMLLALLLVLAGCNMRTFEQLYAPPKRSDAYRNLQNMIDQVMVGFEYSAPLGGQELQAVQMADLDGDGNVEYLLYAKRNGDKPLSIFVFSRTEDDFHLLDTIESTGTAFDQVVYASMDQNKGMEIVVGRQISDQVVRSVSVYSLVDGKIQQVLTANYTKFLCCNLQSSGNASLLVVKPSPVNDTNGVAELYTIGQDNVPVASELPLSVPASRVRTLFVGKLNDGYPAVYVEGEYGNGLITDIFTLQAGKFAALSRDKTSQITQGTQRDYPVYCTDIDRDGIPEIPVLIRPRPSFSGDESDKNQQIITWYGMSRNSLTTVKQYTYHNFTGSWYLVLPENLAQALRVSQQGSGYEFLAWNEETGLYDRVFTLYVLTGQKREEQGTTGNRFVLYRTENTVYAANLDVASAAYGLTQEGLMESFHLIFRDWKNGST